MKKNHTKISQEISFYPIIEKSIQIPFNSGYCRRLLMFQNKSGFSVHGEMQLWHVEQAQRDYGGFIESQFKSFAVQSRLYDCHICQT
jgi:hypothetical protein